jgi:hypothetical protein
MPPRRTWPKASVGASGHRHPALRLGSLGDHDDRRVLVLEAPFDVFADAVEVERMLRDQDHVGAARETRVECDPARVAAHHLDDQRALVALGCGVQPVDRAHGDVHGRVEAKGVVGGAEVVVDRLRHADDLDPLLVELLCGAKRVLAADGDQAVDPGSIEVLGDPFRPALLLERIRPRRPENGPAAREDAADLGHAEWPSIVVQGPGPAVSVADELVPVLADPLAHDRADHRVEARAIPSAGQHAKSHAPDDTRRWRRPQA